MENHLVPITVVKGRTGKPERLRQHVGQPCRGEQRRHLAERIVGDRRLLDGPRRPAGARRLDGGFLEFGDEPLGGLEGKGENAAGQDALLALHDDARGDAIPFFEGSRGGPFTDQNGFAAAEQVAREEGLPGNDGAGLCWRSSE